MLYNNLILNLIKIFPNFGDLDDNGNNVCHHIARYGDNKIFKHIRKNNSYNWKQLLNQRNDFGDTPLHIAMKYNNSSLIDTFKHLGANNISNSQSNFNQNGGGNNKSQSNITKIKGKRYL